MVGQAEDGLAVGTAAVAEILQGLEGEEVRIGFMIDSMNCGRRVREGLRGGGQGRRRRQTLNLCTMEHTMQARRSRMLTPDIVSLFPGTFN